ncbi:hypothetical protein ABBQ38_007486 [Trebouxia sp. C0009 RCD-2024]
MANQAALPFSDVLLPALPAARCWSDVQVGRRQMAIPTWKWNIGERVGNRICVRHDTVDVRVGRRPRGNRDEGHPVRFQTGGVGLYCL